MDQILELLQAVQIAEDGDPVDLSKNPVITEAIRKAMTKGAQTEKAKLYKDLETYKARVTELEAQTGQNQPAGSEDALVNKILAKMEDKLATLMPANTSNSPAAPTAKPGEPAANPAPGAASTGLNQEEQLAAMVSAAFNKVIPKILEPLQSKINDLEKGRVAEYKQQRLKELGGSIIPELVEGNSIEEIDASIKLAQELAKKYNLGSQPAPPAPAPGTPPAQPATPPAPVIPPPANMPTPTSQQPDMPNAFKMTPEQYAAQRGSLLTQLQEKFGNNG
jgi:hypothetical protein